MPTLPKLPEDMTLGDAMAWLSREPRACACLGGPWCCFRVYEQVARLHRAAHIVAKLLIPRADQPRKLGTP
jgi:hypothetical protein